MTEGRPRIPLAAFVVVAAGISAALHLGKLPPAVPALQAALGISLVQAGFLLSLVQVASMLLGLLAGLAADAIGLRRSMLIGLVLLSAASVLGGVAGQAFAPEVAVPWLLVLRGVEGIGFLLAVMPGPGLIRALTPAGADKAALGLWGTFMPFGVALALLLGPVLIGWRGWAGWWWALSGVSALAALWLWRMVPADRTRGGAVRATFAEGGAWTRLGATVSARGPWLAALSFAVYSSQWMAVIGFLPAIYASAGVPATWSAVLTALAAAMNIGGNIAGGRWLQRGVAPERLLQWGFAIMALGGIAAFAQIGQGAEALGLPAWLRFVAVCAFSLAGGMVPATLFLMGVRLAPGPHAVSTTVGLMQQLSALGQFASPPAVAWLANQVGGWHWTWAATLASSLAGIALARRLGHTRAALEAA